MWEYIFKLSCITIKPRYVEKIVDSKEIYKEMKESGYEIRDKKKWICMSGNRGAYHSWNSIEPIVARKYTKNVKKLVEVLNKRVPLLKDIKNQMVLTPSYEFNYDKLNYHQDRFNGEPELVCSYYVGSTQELFIKSCDNRFWRKLECVQGMVRIFQPIMNELLYHAKFIKIIEKPHYCLTLRTSKIRRV